MTGLKSVQNCKTKSGREREPTLYPFSQFWLDNAILSLDPESWQSWEPYLGLNEFAQGFFFFFTINTQDDRFSKSLSPKEDIPCKRSIFSCKTPLSPLRICQSQQQRSIRFHKMAMGWEASVQWTRGRRRCCPRVNRTSCREVNMYLSPILILIQSG